MVSITLYSEKKNSFEGLEKRSFDSENWGLL
jgi:hypothetical protein